MTSWSRIAIHVRVPLGFVFAAAYLWFARPSWSWLIAGVVLVIAGLAVRATAAGHIRKNQELATTGPYAHTRNPLYLGSILIAAGFAVALLSWPMAVVLGVGFAVIYIPVIASEERFLRGTFPNFDEYCTKVPRIIPRLTATRMGSADPSGRFSLDLYLRHREYNAAIGAALLYLSLLFLRPALETFVPGMR